MANKPDFVGLKKPDNETPLSINAISTIESSITLSLLVDEPEVILELQKYQEGSPRNAFAVAALRIGILAMRQAQGQLDAETLRNEGRQLLSDLKHELQSRVTEIDTRVASALRLYFDPNTGHFTERIERLVRKDGDLERVLRDQIGDSDNSELAKTLGKRIGTNSPLMRILDPADAKSIIKSIEASVEEALDEKQATILREFSLDEPNGALTRVVNQLEEKNGELKSDIGKQIEAAVKEFSLDDDDSALSRLVKKVEDANDKITGEFSQDNEHSAINKLNRVLTETKDAIEKNLTLDNDNSALARLRKQLTTVLDDIRSKNDRFQQEVSTQLATLVTKRQEAQRSTTHGKDFETEFCTFAQNEAQMAGDVFTATGNKVGVIPKCKKGDAVIEIGPESIACGQKIVLEAKDDKSYSLEDARAEIDEARKNREANVGIFIFGKTSAPLELQPFQRIDKDVFAIWDASDPSTDVYLKAAVSVAKALLFRQEISEKKIDGDLKGIESSVNAIEKYLQALDKMETWTLTIQGNSGKILKEIKALRESTEDEIGKLQSCVEALKVAQA